MRITRRARAGLLGGLMVVAGLGAGVAHSEELGDKTVGWLMKAAFGMLPDKFTTAEQKVIKIDKSKPDDYMIPLPDAREVVKVAWNSARAQACHILDKQRENYLALVKHETDGAKWNDKQLLYIKQLHLFVVQFGTGSVKITQQGDGQKVEASTETLAAVKPCADDEKKALIDKIDAYVKG